MSVIHSNRANIQKLAEQTIGEKGIESAMIISNKVCGDDMDLREQELQKLAELFNSRQKRPLFYLRMEITHFLPEKTRLIPFYSGMYIEHLIRYYRYDLRRKHAPLGRLLYLLKDEIPEDLKPLLLLFNQVFWANSKHTIGGYPTDEHLYSVEDVVLCCLITDHLAKRIISSSETAKAFFNGDFLI